MKIKHKTQRQLAAEGIQRDIEATRKRQRHNADILVDAARGFIRGLTRNLGDLDPSKLLEDYITEHGLKGDLLRAALKHHMEHSNQEAA